MGQVFRSPVHGKQQIMSLMPHGPSFLGLTLITEARIQPLHHTKCTPGAGKVHLRSLLLQQKAITDLDDQQAGASQ